MKRLCSIIVAASFAAVSLNAMVLQDKFTCDPSTNGWQVYGDPDLFQWDATNKDMQVTWDSSQANSYFYLPLGATYTRTDSFCVVFDLTLNDADAIGFFQLAIGLCKLSDATSTNFSRATGYSPNLFEFDYYPDGPDSYGPTIDATLIDENSMFYFPYEVKSMPTNLTYHIVLLHPAGTSTISGMVFVNNQVFSRMPIIDSYGADDFQLDTLAIFNYTTADDPYGDSLLAHGTVDNLAFATPIPVGVVQNIGLGQVQFSATTNWIYILQRTPDLATWVTVAGITNCTATNLTLLDTNLPDDHGFYRVNADLP